MILRQQQLYPTQKKSYKENLIALWSVRRDSNPDVWVVEIVLNGVSVVKVVKVMDTYNDKMEVVPVSDEMAEVACVKELFEGLVLEGVSSIFKLSPLSKR